MRGMNDAQTLPALGFLAFGKHIQQVFRVWREELVKRIGKRRIRIPWYRKREFRSGFRYLNSSLSTAFRTTNGSGCTIIFFGDWEP